MPLTKWFRGLPRERLETILVPKGIDAWMDRDRVRAFLLDTKRGMEFAWPFAMFGAWQRNYHANL